MAIEGLKPPEAPAVPVASPININDRAALALEALTIVNRVGEDPEATLASIKEEFDKLEQSTDRPGETYVELPFGSGFTPMNMLQTIDGAAYSDGRTYPATYPLNESDRDVSKRLWFPQDASREGYSIAEINRLEVVEADADEPAVRPAHGRLALADGPQSEEPLLHLLDSPYDEMYASKGQPTQLDQLAAQKAEFEAAHSGLEFNATNLAGFAMLALQRRIEGKSMPASWGYMRIPQLGRKSVVGDSWVGIVDSYGVLLWLVRSDGRAYPYDGVGLSVGLEEA